MNLLRIWRHLPHLFMLGHIDQLSKNQRTLKTKYSRTHLFSLSVASLDFVEGLFWSRNGILKKRAQKLSGYSFIFFSFDQGMRFSERWPSSSVVMALRKLGLNIIGFFAWDVFFIFPYFVFYFLEKACIPWNAWVCYLCPCANGMQCMFPSLLWYVKIRGSVMGGGTGGQLLLKVSKKKGKVRKYEVFSWMGVIKINFSIILNKLIHTLLGLPPRF